MKEDGETNGYEGQGIRAALWSAFGVGTAAAAKYVLGDGGLFGGGRPPAGDPPWARDMAYERALTEANAKTAALEAKLDCRTEVLAAERRFEDKLDAIEAQLGQQQTFNATQTCAIANVQQQTMQLMQMTGLIIKAPIIRASEAAAASAPAAASSGS